MRIAYIVFEGVTWLDLIGVYDAVGRLKTYDYIPGLNWDICAFGGTPADNFGLEMNPTKLKPPLDAYDAMVVPGGYGTRALQHDTPFIEWLQTARNVPVKISVCTGSLLLGAAGFLKGKRATTHFQEYDNLLPYCAEVLHDRIVDDGDVITAGAVSASLDLGLYLCKKWAGPAAAEFIRGKMDYRG